ncbi:MAG: DUF368 domain-containing protein [Peptococcaceae bacterium]|nr:DUF368 domain-containing protein [Peptococcaceae bacterium]
MRLTKNILLGLVIGIAVITPGLSGGALAAAIGLYEPIIKAINGLTKEFRPNARFLFPLAVGGTVGILAFSNVMAQMMHYAPDQVKLLALGLVAGSMPALVRQANAKGFHWLYLWPTLVAAFLVYQLGSLPQISTPGTGDTQSNLYYAYYGLIYAVGSIVPGISSSLIFMHLGVYDELLRAVATVHLPVLLPAAAGFGFGGILLIHLVESLFRRYYSPAYYAVIGFLLGSALLIVPSMQMGWRMYVDALILIAGIALSLILLKLSTSST